MNIALATLKTQIALGYLKNKLFIINFLKAFTWASRLRTPFYADTRMSLSYPKMRNDVVAAFLEVMQEQTLQADALWATVTAGIPWGAILAYELNKDLYVYDDKRKKLYRFSNLRKTVEHTYKLLKSKDLSEYDALISNTPIGIVYGAVAAHEAGIPFLYVREARKEHGKKNWIEGHIEEGAKVAYLHTALSIAESSDGTFEGNVAKLKAENIDVVTAEFHTVPGIEVAITTMKNDDNGEMVSRKALEGMQIAIIEDLISTGGSSIGKEAETCRSMGATVKDMIAVFDYKMERAEKAAQDANIRVHHLLDFPYLLEAGHAQGIISTDEKEKLEAWYANPEKYSEEYLEAHADERDAVTT